MNILSHMMLWVNNFALRKIVILKVLYPPYMDMMYGSEILVIFSLQNSQLMHTALYSSLHR